MVAANHFSVTSSTSIDSVPEKISNPILGIGTMQVKRLYCCEMSNENFLDQLFPYAYLYIKNFWKANIKSPLLQRLWDLAFNKRAFKREKF